MSQVHVKRDINLGTVITIFIFLLGQTAAAAWWASGMSTNINLLLRKQSSQESRLHKVETYMLRQLTKDDLERSRKGK